MTDFISSIANVELTMRQFINLVSGSTFAVGEGLKSCTKTVQIAQPFKLGGLLVTLVDTPGFDGTTVAEAESLKTIAAYSSAL